MDGLAVSGEVVTSGTALAGLILIYIGTLVSGFASYAAQEQKAVRGRFQTRAWLAFVGFVLALSAAALGVVGGWIDNSCVANAAVFILLVGFAWAVFATVQTIREIN